MKTFIKLLLLAALPPLSWINAAGQTPSAPLKVVPVPSNLEQTINDTQMDGEKAVQTVKTSESLPQKRAPQKAGASNLIIVQNTYEDTFVACDGTTSVEYVPIWIRSMSLVNTASQFIYPASELDIPEGAVINSITFHASSTLQSTISTATVEVRVSETTSTSIASVSDMNNNRESMTLVYSGTLYGKGSEMTITFDEPFAYSGKNLRIDFLVKTAGNNSTTTEYPWLCKSATSGCSYVTSGGSTSSQYSGAISYLPKMTVSYSETIWEPADEIDFGEVSIGLTRTKNAQINSNEEMTINLSTNAPFGVEPATLNTSETQYFTLTFTPTQAINYTGKLNLEIDGQITSVDIRGVGFKAGEKAVRDKAFFEGIEYTWPIVDSNGLTANSKTSKLSEIATDPDQIIAMLRKIYTDPTIPGNLKRGYTSTGGPDNNNLPSDDVQYTGAGTIVRTNSTTARFDDTYGWDIPGDVDATGSTATVSGYWSSTTYRYWHMDPAQYRPKHEGVTLLLLEMVDNFDNSFTTTKTGYAGLRDYIEATIKSARVITEAKRTGSDLAAGTLFKIDCDKMNKFYLIAKGQLQWKHSVGFEVSLSNLPYYENFYNEPCYIYGGSLDKYSDNGLEKYFMLGHMFEQFSPATSNAEVTKNDIYQELTKNMESFGVDHDCPNVPYVKNGHHFMMYGEDSGSEDCQDVRDMMFLVPDYRMLDHTNRGTTQENGVKTQDYFTYHPDHQPQMGMFVIVQDPIPEGQIKATYDVTDPENENAVTGLYQHQLKWKSNLNKFLPSDEQYYELWEVIINDYGIEEYVPVYERNADGSYVLDSNGNKKPVILNRNAAVGSLDDNNNVVLVFENVYVDMHPGSQTKTYVIRGRDKGDAKGPFLTLQMSNKESIVIPGTDPNEKVRMIGTTHYSRFNPQDVTNCYSNKLQIVDNSLTESELASGLSFTRTYRPAKLDENGNVITDEQDNIEYVEKENAITETIATGRYSATDKKIYIALNTETQASKEAFPKPKIVEDGGLDVAGYHANPVNANNEVAISVDFEGGKLNFKDFSFWDNFTVDVSQNAHPFQYAYKMYVGEAYSNNVPVGVYKTDTKINSFTLGDVLSDQQMAHALPEEVELQGQVQYGSKSELLRYDVYRWDESNGYRYIVTEVGVNEFGNEEETDVAPDGQANNEGEYYTVRMNSGTNEYHTADVPVSQDNPRGWAKYVDLIPQKNGFGAYDYASVVETYGFGLKENKEVVNATRDWVERDDYNTYGGPMKTAAVGQLELSVYEPKDAEVHGNDDHEGDVTLAQMSDYKWYDGGKWYSYYNIYLNFKTLNVPEGYELYKVRAWRRVADGSLVLGEELSSRNDRVTSDWYMYEDINYGDYLGPQKTADGQSVDLKMQLSNIGSQSGYPLGHRSTKIAKPKNPVGYSGGQGGGTVFEYDDTPNPNHDNQAVEELVKNEMRATFGALRMKTDDCPDGIESLNAEFKVRAYFTRGTNKLIQDPQGSTNWGRDGKAQQIVPGSDFDYYIAEGSKTFELTSDNIITGIGAVKMDVNREVVSVSYVNTIGQVSSTPWQGINMVVTRYSDGSTTTKKVIR